MIEHSYDSGEPESKNDPNNISATLYTNRNSVKAKVAPHHQAFKGLPIGGQRKEPIKHNLEAIDSSSEYSRSNDNLIGQIDYCENEGAERSNYESADEDEVSGAKIKLRP